MKDDFEIKNFSSKDIITLKYRPQKFSEFIGQPQVTIPIINSISNGKIHHAYLFYGPRGVGKTSAARILAKMLNCLDFSNNEPCLKCENCIEISNGISTDVIEIDGASNRGIDEIRNLQSNLIYAPTKSRFKIYIIDEVHMLTKEAFNALLKTLEEPPEHIIFIFATTEIHKVLPTIRSRCQQYQFTLFKITDISSQIIKILKEYDVKYDNEVPALIAKYGNGSMRDALSILSQILSYNDREIKIETVYNLLGIYSLDYIKKIFENIAFRDVSSIFTICSEIYYQGISLDNISSQLLEFIRLLTLLKNGVEDINILNQAFTDFEKLTSLSEAFTTKKLILMAKKLIEFQKSFSVWSNPFYAFENLLVSFIYDDFYITATENLNKIQESIKYLEKSFNIIGSKPDEIVLKKTFTNSSQIINKKDLENDKMDRKGLNITEKSENIHLSKNEVYDKEINKIIDKKENSEKEDLEIKKDEKKKLISENLLQILDQTEFKNISNSPIEKTDQIEEDEIKNNYEEKELNDDWRKNKLDMNNFANNLKKTIEKEIEKENIPEPFKKVLKYTNGIYRNKEKYNV